MRKILPLLGLLLWCIPASATVSFVQCVSGGHSSGNGTTVTVTISPTTGNDLVAMVFRTSGDILSSVQDSGSHSFTIQTKVSGLNMGGYDYNFAYLPNVAGGITSVTSTVNNANYQVLAVCEYSGLSATYPADALDAVGGNSSGTVWQAGSITPHTGENQVIIGFTVDTSGSGFTGATSPYTSRVNTGVAGLGVMVVDDIVASTSGSYQPKGTLNNGNNGSAISASYSASAHLPPPVITQISPYIIQGGTLQFTETASDAGTWSLSGTNGSGGGTSGAGSITSGGLYTAPSSVKAQQTEGGHQLFPNNHIFNTRIDSLPVNSNNAIWLAVVNVGGTPAFDGYGMHVNYINNSTPSVAMNFHYTPANNGNYLVPTFPNLELEGGYWRGLGNDGADHHYLAYNTDANTLTEFYGYSAVCITTAASVAANVATLTCSTNPINAGFVATIETTACVGGFTGADTYLNVCPTTITNVTSTSISFALTHANASASSNGQVGLNSAGYQYNSGSGFTYGYSDYALPANGATDAGGGALQPLQMRLEEWNNAVASGGTIKHALRFDFGEGFMCTCYIWPATQTASDGNTVPFGARVRLKSTFNISGYDANTQILLKQLQQYGIIVMDGGNNWDAIQIEQNAWPASYITAQNGVVGAGLNFTITNTSLTSNVATITATNSLAAGNLVSISGTGNCAGALNNQFNVASASGSQFTVNIIHANCGSASDSGTVHSFLSNYMEFIDESSLEVSATSGVTPLNREIVTFTRTSDSATASVDVDLEGVAVNFTKDYLDIMAGSPSQQLTCLTNIGSCTWTMSPTVGALTSGGLYTAPGSQASPTSATITATNSVDSTIVATMNLNVYPNVTARIIPSQSTNYTDSGSHIWYGGYGRGTNQTANPGCCGCGNSPVMTDSTLWNCEVHNAPDTMIDMIVPNGTYQVVYNYGTEVLPGVDTNYLSVQGTIFFKGDFSAIIGGQHLAYTNNITNISVSNNHLTYVIWYGMGGNGGGGTSVRTPISSLSITQSNVIPPAAPPRVGILLMAKEKQRNAEFRFPIQKRE